MTDITARKVQREAPDLGAASVAWWRSTAETFRILLLAKMLDRLNIKILQESAGLSLAEWRLLGQLNMESPASVRQLAQWSWVDRAEVSRAAAALEQRGLIHREENPKDRRSPLFFFTDEGRAVVQRVLPLRREFLTSLTAKLNKSQRQALEEALLIIAQECVARLGEGGAAED